MSVKRQKHRTALAIFVKGGNYIELVFYICLFAFVFLLNLIVKTISYTIHNIMRQILTLLCVICRHRYYFTNTQIH